jgi:ribulose-phosphate 3-epimerase
LPICIAPSIAAGNLLNLQQEIVALENGGADAIHFDVMDGHFVPQLTLGVPFVDAIKKVTTLPLDVHIMVTNPEIVAEDYIAAGANVLTFHIEAATHAHRLCQRIRQAGRKSGIALNPSTHWSAIECLLPVVDQITIMTVNPGYSRQTHLAEMHTKIAAIAAMCARNFPHIEIQIDGGVNSGNAGLLSKIGARNFVAGGAVLGQADYRTAIQAIRIAAEKAIT